MKISGFTIIRNAVKNDYPIVEAIMSILPVVDEMIVLVGSSDDDTEGLIKSINSPKIKLHHSVWSTIQKQGGDVLAEETNKAFALVDPAADWAFYIQADEVVHEKYHAEILEKCLKYKDDNRVDGLLFKYLHFFGNYNYVGDSRRWYSHEVRIIRNNKSISAYRDAQGFRKKGARLKVKRVAAEIYHYGWVKTREKMIEKMKDTSSFWITDQQERDAFIAKEDLFSFDDYDSIAPFTESHPAVMLSRIHAQNFDLHLDVNRKHLSVKNKVLYFIEKLTGRRLFEFKNYSLLRD